MAEALADWRTGHIQQWLHDNGLEPFMHAFLEAGIDGLWLASGITAEDLADMGIDNKLHQKKIQARRDMLVADLG